MDQSGKSFGSDRIYYNNFASHLLNAYNPNLLYPALPHRWSEPDWRSMLDMVAGFGFTHFEFWLVPRLFSRDGIESDYGKAFVRDMSAAIDYAHECGLHVIMLCSLATVGSDWQTLCPNLPDEWRELRYLWRRWAQLLPGLDGVSIFPGDPGACSRNGCTAETFIDKSLEIARLVRGELPDVQIELNTWGPPFFGWGNIRGPEGWRGEFVQSCQHTAWTFSVDRMQGAMEHLLKQLPRFPSNTAVAINLGFNPDGNPDGAQSAIPWAQEIAKTHRIRTWDFSLTEGENNVVPHYRFARLFEQRRREREAAPYSGGICFTMSPLLNQLSLWESAQSFLNPDADPRELASRFYQQLFGPEGAKIVPYLHLFEVVKDWGNYLDIDPLTPAYHESMKTFTELLQDLEVATVDGFAFHPDADTHRDDLLFFSRLFADLSGAAPDYDECLERYWQRVYAIYDQLPEHVDPRPRQATRRLIDCFRQDTANAGAVAGKWVE